MNVNSVSMAIVASSIRDYDELLTFSLIIVKYLSLVSYLFLAFSHSNSAAIFADIKSGNSVSLNWIFCWASGLSCFNLLFADSSASDAAASFDSASRRDSWRADV